jgi:TM2 domain-containing membrane protein YozV
MKKPNLKNNPIIAFMLSFLFPGVGMFYLKSWRNGFINIALLVVLGIFLFQVETVPFFIPLFIGIASGAWAYLEAEEIRKKQA